MSWHLSVREVVCVPSPWVPPFQRPFSAPVLRIAEDARAVDDLRQFRVGQRNLDDVDPEQRGLRVGRRIAARAIRQFFLLANRSGSRNVDVDVVLVLGVDDQGVRVRTAAALHGGHLLRIGQVADIENADTAEPVTAGRRRRRVARVRRPAASLPEAAEAYSPPAAESPACRSRSGRSSPRPT